MTTHAFDDALQLVAQGGGQYQGATQPAWWNMVGPFGGVTRSTWPCASFSANIPPAFHNRATVSTSIAPAVRPGMW